MSEEEVETGRWDFRSEPMRVGRLEPHHRSLSDNTGRGGCAKEIYSGSLN